VKPQTAVAGGVLSGDLATVSVVNTFVKQASMGSVGRQQRMMSRMRTAENVAKPQ
jgi:hypothetical protein